MSTAEAKYKLKGMGMGVVSGYSVQLTAVQLLQLIHPRPEQTLLIYKTVGAETKDIRKMWKDAARALDLPALEQAPDDG